MKKQLIILALSTSFLLANSNDIDLLKEVTNSKISGTQYELNSLTMSKVDGGYTFGPVVGQVFRDSMLGQMQAMLERNRPKSSSSSSNSNNSSTSYNNTRYTETLAYAYRDVLSPSYMTVYRIGGRYYLPYSYYRRW